MATSADVLIIGAGPAGSSAAITCAQAGLSVIILEATAFPRHRPGETLHPGVEPLLVKLGVEDKVHSVGFLRHQGVWTEQNGDKTFHAYGSDHRGPWLGFQAWRAEFDSILLQRAKSLGVEVCHPCIARQVICAGERVTGVITDAGPFHARWILDGSGPSAWLSRQLRRPLQAKSQPLTALYGYATGDRSSFDENPTWTELPRGWLWKARVKPGVYQWTRLFLTGDKIDPAWVPQEFSSLIPVSRAAGQDVTWRSVEDPAGPGFFLLGDAAAMLDPSSSHGVLRAIMSGMLAGHSIRLMCHHPGKAREVLAQYCRSLREWFEFDLVQLRTRFAGSAVFRA